MDDVARTNEFHSPEETYEPPSLRELGTVEELTQIVGGSTVDA